MSAINLPKVIIVNTDFGKKPVLPNEICFIRAMGRKSCLNLSDDTEIVVNHNLGSIMEKLTESQFLRCHKSFVINELFVQAFSSKWLFFGKSTYIPIGRHYREFIYRHFQYLK